LFDFCKNDTLVTFWAKEKKKQNKNMDPKTKSLAPLHLSTQQLYLATNLGDEIWKKIDHWVKFKK